MLRTFLAGALFVAAASAASIVEIATAKDAPFTSLVSLLKQAELVETLSGKGPFTVFAPTDDAFKKIKEIPPPETVKKILLSHVVAGNVKAADLKDGQMVETLSGAKIPVSIKDGEVRVGGAKVTTADVAADNGVVHIIDTVIIPAEVLPADKPKPNKPKPKPKPSTVVDIAVGNTDFSTLVELVTKAGLAGALADKTTRYTVFAPTNAAFKELKAVPEGDALKNVLTYHVVNNFKALKGDGQKFTTLNGQKVAISGTPGHFKVNDANILGVAKAKNGYVYIIDKVLLPKA